MHYILPLSVELGLILKPLVLISSQILRHFKGREHESLIAFQDFIITPSYALVVMDFHPRLIPVEMPETRAKRYIAQLLSALDYLHTEGCTHNDIKPSNILLSKNDKAVLCDFGFAQRYSFEPHTDTNSNTGKIKQPFMSTLSWGTPEYLSPERVKSQLHDERLSDLWSLGVTAYEVSLLSLRRRPCGRLKTGLRR